MSSHTYTPEETAQLRTKTIEETLLPAIQYVFDRFPVLQSVMVVVGQFWDDGAQDEIHFHLVFSELNTPDYPAWCRRWKLGLDEDSVNLPSIGNLWDSGWEDAYNESGELGDWPSLLELIPAFAAYCKEGGHQDFHDPDESFTPYAILHPEGEAVDIEIVGTMLRPWLDGVKVEAE